MIANNFYFLVLTGITVVTGNYFFNRLRFSEFCLRFEPLETGRPSRRTTRSCANWTRSRAASSPTSAMSCARR